MKPLAVAMLSALMLCGCEPPLKVFIDGTTQDVDAPREDESTYARHWMPLERGNEWVFREWTSGRTMRVTAIDSELAEVVDLFDEPLWLRIPGATSSEILFWDGQTWQTLANFSPDVHEWQIGEGTCTGVTASERPSPFPAETYLRTFGDVRYFNYRPISEPGVPCPPPMLRWFAFAPGVGPVAVTTGGNESYPLLLARVGGEPLPGDEVTVALGLDQSEYVSKPLTVACVEPPCDPNGETAVARLTFEVHNVGVSPVYFISYRGCGPDAEVYDAEGRIVRRLLDHAFCRDAVAIWTLEPGESKTYNWELDLTTTEGQQLEGTYTVRAAAQHGLEPPQAEATFSVRIESP